MKTLTDHRLRISYAGLTELSTPLEIQVNIGPTPASGSPFAGLTELSLNWQFLEKVWKPDTFFVNGKRSYLHKITVPNRLLRLSSDGTLLYSQRLTIKASCPMRLKRFPLDTQVCPLQVASYGYRARDVVYRWNSKLVSFEEELSLAQYDMVNWTYDSGVLEPTEMSFVTVWFHLERRAGFYILQVYIPCYLIVSCSWVGFWIHRKDAPGRVGLGATTVLTITTMGFVGSRSTIPRTGKPTSLDFFFVMCFAFVFSSLVEYAFINYFERLGRMGGGAGGGARGERVDIYARRIFPLAFLALNLVYWMVSLYGASDEIELPESRPDAVG
ncbi:unnamed protein product [Darwinula stevensoni]|uniref:Uncharacterized protein n=1 Tax=Darwinula stevensoni TaxID=69355 RepID=A0A7R9AH52_9CRUS|nr:unnamed protein product [Darwinula stevensoni]CAG0904527.1 unnamed protein product [Darwinula stevensoni]